jgi:cobalt-zinc-cadmium efflux system membrane fusion protein
MPWFSFAVFPPDAAKVTHGQVVNMTADNRKSSSVISFMNSGRGEQASIFARVPLDNSNGDWTPGLFVEAKVIVSETNVALAVSNRAIHEVDGQTVVFTVHNNHGEESFEVTPIRIGKKDNQFTEVVSGLEANTRYAIENSYLLKAELEKSGASHDH